MTYCCNDCGFLFRRTGEVGECPSCEGTHLRAATQEEAQRFHRLLLARETEKTKNGNP